ncbi:MAG: hypothetical protein ACOYXR_07280 [Nitrospirota bacterium]
MTLFGITLAFSILLAALGSAMIIHSIVGKRRILADFRKLSARIGGRTSQPTVFSFPRVDGRFDGREAAVFFHLAKGDKASIIYVVYTLSAKAATALFLSKDKYYKPVNDPTKLSREAGEVVPGLDGRYEVRTSDVARANRLFNQGDIRSHLDALEPFPSLMFGPDLLVAGKPFESAADTHPESALKAFRAMDKIAAEMEAVA